MPLDPDTRFAGLVESLRGRPRVAGPDGPGSRTRFGSDALKVDGKIFAMLVDGRLVVKLPKARVAELVRDGHGTLLDTGGGRRMKEWLSLSPESSLEWLALATEALDYVGRTPAPERG